MQNEEAIIKFKNAVEKSKTQSFTESIISSLYFFYVISYFGKYFNYKAYELAWFLIEHRELL